MMRLIHRVILVVLFSAISPFSLIAQNGSNLAPSAEEIAAKLPGRTINGTYFTSATRFNWNGELGNWRYALVSSDVGAITQTYDEDNNDYGQYREVTILTFQTATSGTFVYREYSGGFPLAEESGTFDFPWLADVPTWEPQGWVYFNWPYAYSFSEGRWHFFNESDLQWRVNLSNGAWDELADATGWNYYNWPYSYSTDEGTWHWYNADTQWVVDLISGVWARLGESGVD